MKPPMLEADTANHAVYGAVIALAALAMFALFGMPHGAVAAVAAAVAFGAGKETADYLARRSQVKAGTRPTHGVEWASPRSRIRPSRCRFRTRFTTSS